MLDYKIKFNIITNLDWSAEFLPLRGQFAIGITIASVEFLEHKFKNFTMLKKKKQ